jgi:hypothetical protein
MQTSMTIHQLAELVIKEIRKMTPDEKAHLRAKLRRAFGPAPERKPYKM